MEKLTAVIELTSKSVKLIVGCYINNQVEIIYTKTQEIGNIIDAGKIIDKNSLLSYLKEINFIEDAQAKLKINLSEAILVVPPLGIEIFSTKQSAPVISSENKVNNYVIKNLYEHIRNSSKRQKESAGLELIDIVPYKYELDNGVTSNTIPYNSVSTGINAYCRLHFLPKTISQEYRNSLVNSNIVVKRMTVAPQGALEYFGNDTTDTYPGQYFLIDIGAKITTVSLIGNKQLYSSRFFTWGGDNITDKIVANFNINPIEAEKIKKLYGYDKREYSFDPTVATCLDANGETIKFNLSQLKQIIKKELDSFVIQLNSSMEVLTDEHDNQNDKIRKLPIILIGGGSQLTGLVSYIEPKLPNDKVILGESKVMGARRSDLINLLGMIVSNHKYPNVYDESHQKVTELTRDS